MVGLLDSLRRLDRDLVRSFDVDIEPQLFLEDVESGSIKSWIATVLRSADDEALKSGDWKKLLGNYLVKAKYVVLEHLENVPTIAQPQLLERIQAELASATATSGLGLLIGYTPLTRTQLAAHIADITTSLEPLRNGDRATFEGFDGEPVPFNRGLRVNADEIQELLATRTISNDNELILKVKKPDFLGQSMWEFHYEGRTIQASILDTEWLEIFRRDGLGVRPGVALRALVKVQAGYDDDNEALPARYAILKVYEVIPPTAPVTQMEFDEFEDVDLSDLFGSSDDDDDRGPLLLPPPSPDEPE